MREGDVSMSSKWAVFAVAVSAACFGTSAVLAPLAYESGARPLPLLVWRFGIAGLLLTLVVTLRDRRAMVVPRGDLGRYAALALTGYGIASICFFYALLYADAAIVAVLLYVYPTLVMIGGWIFLRESPNWRQVLAILLTAGGCVLVVGLGSPGAHGVRWQGIALGLAASVSYATYSLLSHVWLPGRSRLTLMAYVFGTAAILPASIVLVTEGYRGLSVAGWTGATWILLGAIVALPTFAAVLLYLGGIRGLGASRAALVSTLEPVFTIILARIFLPSQAPLAPLQCVGAALVLAGVVLAESAGAQESDPAAV